MIVNRRRSYKDMRVGLAVKKGAVRFRSRPRQAACRSAVQNVPRDLGDEVQMLLRIGLAAGRKHKTCRDVDIAHGLTVWHKCQTCGQCIPQRHGPRSPRALPRLYRALPITERDNGPCQRDARPNGTRGAGNMWFSVAASVATGQCPVVARKGRSQEGSGQAPTPKPRRSSSPKNRSSVSRRSGTVVTSASASVSRQSARTEIQSSPPAGTGVPSSSV